MGAGSWHDCGEDTCCCIDTWPNEYCNICHGEGVLPEDEYEGKHEEKNTSEAPGQFPERK